MVPTYYWKDKPNFGDLLTPHLLRRFTKLRAVWATPEQSELVVTGSILGHLPESWTGVVAGAGKMHESIHIKLPKARVLALRGPLTAKDFKGNFALAEPGLLADELVPVEDKQYNLGIVPHWTDRELEHDPRFTKYSPKIIYVNGDPLKVVRDIGLCRKIVSSSLHGIVLADAFGIPRRIEIAPRMLSHPNQEGGLFKWQDYSASLGMNLEIGLTQEVERNIILEKQYELFDVFSELNTIFKANI